MVGVGCPVFVLCVRVFATAAATSVTDQSTPTRLSVSWIGTGAVSTTNRIKVSKMTSFGVNELYFTTSVTLENVGSVTLYNVSYMRHVDGMWE